MTLMLDKKFVKNKMAPKYIKKGVVDSEAVVLGVLEVFSSEFEKIDDAICHS